MRPRFGIRNIKRASAERRTFEGVVYSSLLERERAVQLRSLSKIGWVWHPHPKFELGPDETYRADFRVEPQEPIHLHWMTGRKVPKRNSVFCPSGWVEEVKAKGGVRTGLGRLKRLWRKYGQVPLAIMNGSNNGHTWDWEVVVPDAMKPKKATRKLAEETRP